MTGNVIVGQSGGPTCVINASLAGVYKTAKDRGATKVYGMLNGIKGLLERRYVDLAEHLKGDLDIELLKRTPSSYLGSCRYKLPEICDNREIYDTIFEILGELNINYFFYIGGNDSMDTIKKLSDYAILINSDIKFIGVPKTIDNTFVSAQIEMVPQNYQKLESEEHIKLMEKLIDIMEDDDDVQNIWHNWEE